MLLFGSGRSERCRWRFTFSVGEASSPRLHWHVIPTHSRRLCDADTLQDCIELNTIRFGGISIVSTDDCLQWHALKWVNEIDRIVVFMFEFDRCDTLAFYFYYLISLKVCVGLCPYHAVTHLTTYIIAETESKQDVLSRTAFRLACIFNERPSIRFLFMAYVVSANAPINHCHFPNEVLAVNHHHHESIIHFFAVPKTNLFSYMFLFVRRLSCIFNASVNTFDVTYKFVGRIEDTNKVRNDNSRESIQKVIK